MLQERFFNVRIFTIFSYFSPVTRCKNIFGKNELWSAKVEASRFKMRSSWFFAWFLFLPSYNSLKYRQFFIVMFCIRFCFLLVSRRANRRFWLNKDITCVRYRRIFYQYIHTYLRYHAEAMKLYVLGISRVEDVEALSCILKDISWISIRLKRQNTEREWFVIYEKGKYVRYFTIFHQFSSRETIKQQSLIKVEITERKWNIGWIKWTNNWSIILVVHRRKDNNRDN